MFTDMVGYSALAQSNEATALELLDRHNATLRPIFRKYAGREVKTVGDAFLVEFESALDAVRCAFEIQQSLHDANAGTEAARRIEVRIGIHVGDVVQTGGDVLGDAVNIASRIQPLAAPGGICLTQQVVDQVANKIPHPLARLPPTPLKNIRSPVTVYRVVPPWESARSLPISVEPVGERQLAVLPLANISPDPTDAYFADGLTEELISVLSQVRGLCVIARTSVMPYKTAPKSVAQVGAELGVDTVLEGSVRKAGNRLRITLQLVDVSTQRHIWASSYNREVDDVFAVQTDIAERTADALRLELDTVRGGRRAPTTNLAAYDLYLRGQAALSLPWGDPTSIPIDEAVRYFERATQLDPTFAEAFAAWGNAYVLAAGDTIPMSLAIPKARELVDRALKLDPASSDGHAALANLTFQYDHAWPLAEAEFRRAIELNPSNLAAHRFFGMMLFALGRFDEAKALVRRAIQLDPAGRMGGLLAWIEFESGNFGEALRFGEQVREQHPTEAAPHLILGTYYVALGRLAEAKREADVPFEGASDDDRFDHALLNAMVGRPEEAREVIARVKSGHFGTYVSASHLAMLYSALGEASMALDLLEKDYREGDRVLWLWSRGAFFDPIRNDPRFLALLEKYGLPVEEIRHPFRLTGDSAEPTGHVRRRAHARGR